MLSTSAATAAPQPELLYATGFAVPALDAVTPPTGLNFTFRPTTSPELPGYVVDAGATYAARNGQSYGWTVDHSSRVFDRAINLDPLLDTVVSVAPAARWELAVPSGQYTVKVGVGDAAASSRNNVWIESVRLYDYESLAADAFTSKSITVNVSDGRLTLGIGSAPTDTVKINFIEVAGEAIPPVPPPPASPPPASPPPASPPSSDAVRVNFQPSAASGVEGYLPDAGELYAERNDHSYGWTTDHTALMFDRQVQSDQRLDTVVAIRAASRWELAVPKGQYTVLVSVGDVMPTRNNIWIEGVQLFNYESRAANTFSSRSITVNVDDGRLTMGIGSAPSDMVKVNFIEVVGASVSSPTSPPPTSPPTTSPPPTSPPPAGIAVNFQPAASPPVSGYLPDSGELYAARQGQAFGWTTDHAALVFDREAHSDQRLDTVVSVSAAARWELAVPNGPYTVKVSVGDPAASSRNNVWIEGVQLFNYQSLAANTFSAKSVTVTVSDGRMTMGIGSASAGSVKINFIEITNPTTSPPPTSPPPTSPPPSSMGVAAPVVSASAAGTSAIALTWNAPSAADAGKIARYTVRYVVGAYKPGIEGQPQIIDVPAGETGTILSGLFPFELYSIEVRAVDIEGGSSGASRATVFTDAPADQQRYLYAFRLPKNRVGFPDLKPQIEVFDINNSHQWVKNIPLPTGIYNVRGVAANYLTNRMYLTYFLAPGGGAQAGGMLAMNLNTGAVLWRKDFSHSEAPAPDRFDLTPDGKTIYLPSTEEGDERYWSIIDAATGAVTGRVYHTSSPHNTIVSLDGTRVFLEGQEKGTQPADVRHTIGVVDTATNQVVQKVGPFMNVVRPFTINGKGSLVFAVVNSFVGIQIGDVTTGKILYTAAPANYTQPTPSDINHTHGILLTPDEKEVWMVDTRRTGIHVFDVSDVPNGPPKYVKFIATRKQGRDLDGAISTAASQDTISTPSWLNRSHDGKYVYAESGEVISVATKQVVGQLRARRADGTLAPYTHSRFMLEIDFINGQAVRATDQFGVGLVR